MSNVSLATLMVPTQEVEVDYPGIDGFKVKVAFQSREELIKLRKKATTKRWKGRELIEDVDDQLFLQLYVKAVIKGWSGLKLKDLSRLVLVDLSNQPDPDAELEYSEENALQLMKGSVDFDSFVSDTVSDLTNFPQANLKKSKS